MTQGMQSPNLEPANAEQPTEARAEHLLAICAAVARELHAGRAGQPPPALEDSLERDIGLDSLARVELGARIERELGVALPESRLFEAETARDLLGALLEASGSAPLRQATARAAPAGATGPAGPAGPAGTPAAAATLIDMLEWHATRHADRPHIQLYDEHTDGAVITYGELWQGAAEVAGGLQAAGLEPGERVALMLPTGRDYFLAFYGTLLAGGVPVPIYPPVRRAQLEDHLRRQRGILDNCAAAMLVTGEDATLVARLLTAAVESLRRVVTVAGLSGEGTAAEIARPAPADLAFLQYTSGSTGEPKGVMLSHANLLANIRADGRGMAATADDVFVSWLPLYHDMGLIGAWLGSLYFACRLVVMPPLTFLARPQRWLWAIHRHGGTLSAAPNFAFELCVKRVPAEALEGLDLSGWRLAANGAEAVSVQTLEAFCERFAACGFRREAMFPVYGLAECAVGLSFPPLGRGPRIDRVDRAVLAAEGRAVPPPAGAPEQQVQRIVACGLPLPGHEIRIVDEADRELPERREGRVQFRGPSATAGYFRNPEATARLVREGWLETGDRGYLSEGELFVTGRVKDIIIRAGRNIYPVELEEAIGELDGIRKGHVAVFAAVDPASETERMVVLAETRRRDEAARERLRKAIQSLASDLTGTPADEVVLAPPNTVLRTSSGKIRRAATREIYEQGHIGARGAPVWLQAARLGAAAVRPRARRALASLGSRLHAGYAWTVFGLLALPALVLGWLPMPEALLWRCERAIAGLLGLATLTRIEVIGREHLPPPGKPCVVAANHQSYLDGLALFAVLPRRLRFLIKADLAGAAILGRPLARLGALFVRRFDAAEGVAGLQEAVAALAAGEALLVFPEGTFKRMPGVLPFHLGAFAMAVDAGAPLVPVAIHGTRSMLRSGTWFPRRGRIRVHIGEPLQPDGTRTRWPAALELRDRARAHILAHCREPDLAHESNRVEVP